ncbi:MAG: hypothetical protein SPK70_08210 [Succinivibrio dextrinosolvens]|nr:hypothetical protein [Succinivibrio dextrinosolvens]MDY6471031.1 hypothetical protein [Succinivibrio dextrinosolvens]
MAGLFLFLIVVIGLFFSEPMKVMVKVKDAIENNQDQISRLGQKL